MINFKMIKKWLEKLRASYQARYIDYRFQKYMRRAEFIETYDNNNELIERYNCAKDKLKSMKFLQPRTRHTTFMPNPDILYLDIPEIKVCMVFHLRTLQFEWVAFNYWEAKGRGRYDLDDVSERAYMNSFQIIFEACPPEIQSQMLYHLDFLEKDMWVHFRDVRKT